MLFVPGLPLLQAEVRHLGPASSQTMNGPKRRTAGWSHDLSCRTCCVGACLLSADGRNVGRRVPRSHRRRESRELGGKCVKPLSFWPGLRVPPPKAPCRRGGALEERCGFRDSSALFAAGLAPGVPMGLVAFFGPQAQAWEIKSSSCFGKLGDAASPAEAGTSRCLRGSSRTRRRGICNKTFIPSSQQCGFWISQESIDLAKNLTVPFDPESAYRRGECVCMDAKVVYWYSSGAKARCL